MDALAHVPERLDRLDSQGLHLREEMRTEFSTVRTELAAGSSGLRSELGADIRVSAESIIGALRDEIRTGDEGTRRTLRDEVHENVGALGVQMRTLHEEVIARLALIQEGQSSRGAPRRSKKRP